MSDIYQLCLFPQIFIKHLKAHELLKEVFNGMNEEEFTKMMRAVISRLMTEDNNELSFTHYFDITEQLKAAWMECFDATLDELCVSSHDSIAMKNRMNHILYDEEHKSEEICKFIMKAVSSTNHPEHLIEEIKHCIEEFLD